MHINKQQFNQLIRNFNFQDLFIELGWDHARVEQDIKTSDEIYKVKAIAEKRGFVIFICSPNHEGNIPDKAERRKIDTKLTSLYFEHLIIFQNEVKSQQIWQLNARQPNQPVRVNEIPYHTHQNPELLYQKLRGLFFSLDEEDNISIVDVKERISENFNTNTERVTKKFYDQFKKEHARFLNFIKGIEHKVDQEWYASLMLNRLMFIYFIQKKGFLNNDPSYLRNKLNYYQEQKGKDKFYKSFYRNFLLVLFHRGLGSPEKNDELHKILGKIPYLNGGLFDVHELEKDADRVNIEDKAFEHIFDFFDTFNWYLDTRVTASGDDINPDVIGYIFEKYINDRASMGAYYTKEDITDYISKNCMIPFLFDAVRRDCANAFQEGSSLWQMLDKNPDRYIYDSVRKGVALPLPEEIEQGIGPDNVAKRTEWNKPAPEEYALSTEIWREVVARRERYFEIREKIETGEIRNINDFITYNLDIKQFAQDAVTQYEGSDFINTFYKAIKCITILDPTCGSGAFLFAALNILEPLYEACIERMREFVEVDDQHGGGKKFSQFRAVLSDIEKHPNEKYYIYKTIILHNLYGVDIMKEAVETAKLRLFLKLVGEATVDLQDENNGLEPLPDIDFNIRAGNTLIGYATKTELDKGLRWNLDFENTQAQVEEKMEMVARTFRRFKEIQEHHPEDNYQTFKTAKDDLHQRLHELTGELNYYLGKTYGQEPKTKPEAYTAWKASHQPFHWFAEFYEIIHEYGGFDVIIGNPPYVSSNSVLYKLIKVMIYKFTLNIKYFNF